MAGGTASIRVTGNVTEALAALDALGIRCEETGVKADEAFGDSLASKVEGTGGMFGKLGNIISNLGLPFGESFTKMGEKIGEADTEGKGFSQTMKELGTVGSIAVAAGLAVAAAEGIHLAENYQKSTASLAANAGISMKAANAIGSAFLDTAGKSTFSGQEIMNAYAPVAAQLATVTGHALDSKEAMTVMAAAMDLAEGSGTDLTSSTSALASVMQAFHIGVSGASEATDVLFNVSRMTNTGVAQVATTVDRLHARLGIAAPSLDDVGALMASLAEHGATGARGMNVVSTAMTTLLGGSKAVTAELDTLGVHMFTANGHFVGMQSVIAQLGPKLNGLTQQQQMLAEKTLFGAGASQLMGQVMESGVTSYNKAAEAVTKVGSAHAAAEKQAATFHGEMEKMKATAEDLGVKLGEVLIPILQRVAQVIADVVGWMMKHRAVALILMATLAVVFAPFLTAIVAVSLAIYEFAMHWKQIWNDIQQWVSDAINFIKTHWMLILGILTGPVGLAIGWIIQHWNGLVSFFTGIPNDIVNALSALPGDMWTLGVNMIEGLVNGIEAMASDVGGALQSILDHVPGVSLLRKVPGLSFLAEGGIITRPTLAVIGEAGPEAVLPLSHPYLTGGSSISPLGGGGGGGGGGQVILQIDGRTLGQVLWPYLRTAGLQTTARNARGVGLGGT